MPRVVPHMTAHARQLRTNATDTERALWALLAPYRPRFSRQFVVGRYIVDIACREAKVAIEIDGGQHADQTAYDDARTAFLTSIGWQVIRLWNSDVRTNPEGAATHVLSVVAQRLGTHPRPLPSREGRVRHPRKRLESPAP